MCCQQFLFSSDYLGFILEFTPTLLDNEKTFLLTTFFLLNFSFPILFAVKYLFIHSLQKEENIFSGSSVFTGTDFN